MTVGPDVLVRIPLADSAQALLERDFALHHLVGSKGMDNLDPALARRIRAVITNGTTGLRGDQMRALPGLEIVVVQGAGYEGIDLDTAKALLLPVTTGGGTNVDTVADHAIGLMLAVARGIPFADQGMKDGDWNRGRLHRPIIFGRKLGIVGLGQIGARIADRARGFEMEIGYHGRTRRAGVSYPFFSTPQEIAAWADFLVLSCMGGPATTNLVDAVVLDALGPEGFVVNIARGSVVNLDALLSALNEGLIAGAALDVFPDEPDPPLPEALRRAPNLVMTPHIAGRSPQATATNGQRLHDNLIAHFAGRPLVARLV